MTSLPITVTGGTLVGAAARRMEQHLVKRLPVLDDETGALIGIVTRRDLLRRVRRSDEAIECEDMDELLHGLWLGRTGITADVHDGVVTLSGTAERRSAALLAAELTGDLDGVVTVMNDVAWRVEDKPIRRRHIFDAELRWTPSRCPRATA